MSKLLPNTATVTLENGETLTVRALSAMEILRMGNFLYSQLTNMGDGKP